MEQSTARLELPPTTYSALEQMANREGTTPLRLIEDWMQQHQQKEKLSALRQEYHELIDRDLQRVLTADEEQRLDSLCAEINALEMHSDANTIWLQQAEAIDAQFEALKRTLATFPEQQAKV